MTVCAKIADISYYRFGCGYSSGTHLFVGVSQLMDSSVVFGIGMIGAIAPEVVRLYSLRSQGGEKLSGFYFGISAVFAALGGVVALILPATTLWGAFYAGISTPVVISTALKKGLDKGDDDIRGGGARPDREERRTPSLLRFVKAL
jgi:mannose/fructose/N-acetylgalactosamine-specific phosphotransferase system component IID